MKIPKQAKRNAKALFRSCVVNGLLDENKVRQMVDEVIQGKPRGYVPTLVHFQRLVKLDLQRRSATIESPMELSAEEKRQIESSLQARYGGGVSCSYRINPALIGGARIRVGSDVFDGTVAGRLQALQESFQAA